MKYKGSAGILWREFAHLILQEAEEGDFYIEPFGGGMNCITQAPPKLKRFAFDLDFFTIHLWRCLQKGYTIPDKAPGRLEYELSKQISKEVIQCIVSPDRFSEEVLFNVAINRFLNSYAGIPYSSYAGDRKKSPAYKKTYWEQSRDNLKAHLDSAFDLKSICFNWADYREINLKNLSNKTFIFCNPPEQLSKRTPHLYGFNFNSFWAWCRETGKNEKIRLFILSNNAPDDFYCLEAINTKRKIAVNSDLEDKLKTNRLWTVKLC